MMNKPELFSEIYGCYYTVVARILEQAQQGMAKEDIENLVKDNAFYDSAFHMLPKLFSGEWNLLEKGSDNRYYSRLKTLELKRPMTDLEKSWLKSLLSDKRILLFISDMELSVLENELSEVSPLFLQEDLYFFDVAADGDPYTDRDYRENFRRIHQACMDSAGIIIDYEGGKGHRLKKYVLPYKISYSGRDDKFRLHAVSIEKNKHKSITINIARVRSVDIGDEGFQNTVKELDLGEAYEGELCEEPIILQVSRKRNGLERCMLQFASWKKQTEYDEENDRYICKIYYDKQEESELLIRVLSFGPVVRVLGPEGFLRQVKERVYRQYEANSVL